MIFMRSGEIMEGMQGKKSRNMPVSDLRLLINLAPFHKCFAGSNLQGTQPGQYRRIRAYILSQHLSKLIPLFIEAIRISRINLKDGIK